MFKLQPLPDSARLTQIAIAAVGAILPGIIYLALPDGLTLGPNWLLLVVLVLLVAPALIPLLFFRRRLPYRVVRGLALAQLTVMTIALAGSLALLISQLPSSHLHGSELLRTAALLWTSNIVVFAVWYWEIDGNGPQRRHEAGHIAMDFQFTQQAARPSEHPVQASRRKGEPPHKWAPGFIDYLFLAFCTATALSPADTMPLTQRAKLLMMIEASLSAIILVLLIARSVNIL